GLAAAALEVPRPAAEAVHARIHDVGIRGIDVEIRAAGEGVLVQHFLPRLATVDGLEDAALLVRPPFVSQRADVRDVRVARVHDDARDLLRVAEPEGRPAGAGVRRLVDPV